MIDYRIINLEEDGIPYFAVCEVYYDENQVAYAWSANCLQEPTVAELKETFELIKGAYNKPILKVVNGVLVKMEEIPNGKNHGSPPSV